MRAALVGVGGLIAAAGVAGAVFLAVGDGGEEEVLQDLPTGTATVVPETASPTVSATVSPNPTAEWESHTDSATGFYFFYPPDLMPKASSGPGTANGGREDYLRLESPSDAGRIALVSFIANDLGLSLDDWAVGGLACNPETVSQSSLAGVPAVQCTSQPGQIPESVIVADINGVFISISSLLPSSEFSTIIDSAGLSESP